MLIIIAMILGGSFSLLTELISVYVVILLILVLIAAFSFLLAKMAEQSAQKSDEQTASEMTATESAISQHEKTTTVHAHGEEKPGEMDEAIHKQGIANKEYVVEELADLNEMETIALQQFTEEDFDEDETKNEEKIADEKSSIDLDLLLEDRLLPSTNMEERHPSEHAEAKVEVENQEAAIAELEEVGVIAENKDINDEEEPLADSLNAASQASGEEGIEIDMIFQTVEQNEPTVSETENMAEDLSIAQDERLFAHEREGQAVEKEAHKDESTAEDEVQSMWKKDYKEEPFVTSEERMSLFAELESEDSIIDVEEHLPKIERPINEVKVEIIEDTTPQMSGLAEDAFSELLETDERKQMLENGSVDEEEPQDDDKALANEVMLEEDEENQEAAALKSAAAPISQEEAQPLALAETKISEESITQEVVNEKEMPQALIRDEKGSPEENLAPSAELADEMEKPSFDEAETKKIEIKVTEEKEGRDEEQEYALGIDVQTAEGDTDLVDKKESVEADVYEPLDSGYPEKEATPYAVEKESLVLPRSAFLSKEEIQSLFFETEDDEEALNEAEDDIEYSLPLDEKSLQEDGIMNSERNKLPPQVIDAVLEEIAWAKKHLPSEELESMLMKVADPSLNDEDYYLFASLLRDFYIERGDAGKLNTLFNELERRYAENPVILEEVRVYRSVLHS